MAKSSRANFTLLAAGNLAGKATAILREVIFASAFGTGPTAAGFRLAQGLSFVPANLITGDVLSGAFVPEYSRALKSDATRASMLATTYCIAVTGTLVLLATVLVGVARPLITVVVPGADIEVVDTASMFLQLLCASIPLYGLSSVLALVLASHQLVGVQSLRPSIQSVGLLAGTLLAVATGWLPFLAIAFVAAWAAYTATALVICGRRGLLSARPSWHTGVGMLRTDLTRVAPLLPLPIAFQASIMLERTFSSLGQPELLAAVDYARLLSDSAISLVAVPLGLLGLTRLSAVGAVAFGRNVVRGATGALIVVTPLAAIAVVLAPQIISFVYQRGQFDGADVSVTAAVLQGQCVLLAAQVVGYFLSRALMATGRNRVVLLGIFAALGTQAAVQSLVVTPLGATAIGLGPSMYGLVLLIVFGRATGVLRPLTPALGCALASLAPAIVAILTSPPLPVAIWLAVLAILLWAAQFLFARLRQAAVDEFIRPIAQRLRRQT